jgi:hypothetical protein
VIITNYYWATKIMISNSIDRYYVQLIVVYDTLARVTRTLSSVFVYFVFDFSARSIATLYFDVFCNSTVCGWKNTIENVKDNQWFYLHVRSVWSRIVTRAVLSNSCVLMNIHERADNAAAAVRHAIETRRDANTRNNRVMGVLSIWDVLEKRILHRWNCTGLHI